MGLRGLQEQSSEARTLSLFVGRDEASRAGTWGGGGPGGSGWSGEMRSGRSDWPGATKCGEHAAIVRFGVALRDDGRTGLEGWE